MEITTTQENLVEKLFAQIMKNVEAQLRSQEGLSDEEIQANLVIAKRSATNDANAVANLVFNSFAE